MSPGDTPPERSAIPSKRNRSSTPIPARSPTVSACWDAIFTADIARTGSPRRLCAIPRPSRRRWRHSPEALVRDALDQGAKVLVSTYNEPLITSEWAVAVFKEAKAAGLLTGFVSNGNATPQVLEYLRPHLDLYKVDLKSFDDRHYHELGGRIAPILDSIRRIHQMGLWLEIVTLLIPGFNDSADELRRLTEFLAGISPDIPWHVTAFHTDYKMQGEGQRDTTVEDLLQAAEIGQAAGLRYIYAGNLPGMVGHWEDTRCPQCHETLIRRYGYHIEDYRLTPEGRCPRCSCQIPGRWAAKFDGQITSHPFLPHKRARLFTITSR